MTEETRPAIWLGAVVASLALQLCALEVGQVVAGDAQAVEVDEKNEGQAGGMKRGRRTKNPRPVRKEQIEESAASSARQSNEK